MSSESIAGTAWAALGADPVLLDGLDLPGGDRLFSSAFPVPDLLLQSVAVASLAVNVVAARRRGHPTVAPVRLDPDRVATSCASDRYFRLDGRAFRAWSDLSGFFPAADGWIRAHANYPHHAARLRALLDLPPDAAAVAVRGRTVRRTAADLEEAAEEAGAVVSRVRTPEEWLHHPQGRAAADQPLIAVERIGEARARPWHPLAAGAAPLAGVRVLDLTRVIAGPVAGRMLAHAGADVLRVDPPRLLEPEWFHLDTGAGKRSALLDLDAVGDRRLLHRLAAKADVVLTGYRPGSLDRFGLSDAALRDRYPGLVIARVSAWHPSGPWAARRGFDSIVQAASGIAVGEGRDGTPGALPVQALDHAAGYLLSAAVVHALISQRDAGGTHGVRVSLDRVAHELLRHGGGGRAGEGRQVKPTLVRGLSRGRLVECAAPAASFEGSGATWPAMATPLGSDEPAWLDR